MDLKAFYARYTGGGSRNQPFHPAMIVKVLVYGYATGLFSSLDGVNQDGAPLA